MVNETVLNYLKSYSNEFPIEKLRAEIISKGYTTEEFEEALKIVSPKKEIKEMPEPVEKKVEFKRIPSQPIPTKKKMKEQKTDTLKGTRNKEKPIKEKKTKVKQERKAKVWPWILLLIVLLAIGVIILNYYGTSVFGFNIFRLI